MSESETDAPVTGREGSRWTGEHARALILPLSGLLGVVGLVAIDACTSVNETVATAGITAVVTLTASAGGHAAGSAKANARRNDK